MYNANPYNTALYNGIEAVSGLADQDTIVFDGFSLQNANIVSSLLLQDSTPSRDLPANKIPQNDGEFLVGDFWRRKIITVSGTLRGSSASDLNDRIDEMKKRLRVLTGNLDIKVNGVIRRYPATLNNGLAMFSQRRHFHITFVPFSVQFLTVLPFAQSVNYVEDLFIDKTQLSSTENTSNDGTIHAEDVISLNFSAASGITAVDIENTTNGKSISISQSISAADLLVIDGENKTVKLNGTLIDYSGFFPRLEVGGNSFTITLTGTSATFTLSIKHKTPYL